MVREENYPDDFGSAFAEYANQRCEIRLLWDGKEGLAVLQIRPTGTSTWSGLAGMLTEGDLEGVVIQMEKVNRWCEVIRGLAEETS